jgi:probable rRNA maturation factor
MKTPCAKMPEIINNQRKIKIERPLFQKFAETAAVKITETENKIFNVVLVYDRKMRELNNDFRGKNATTDVLSFPFEADEFEANTNFLGDIVISVEQAAKQAAENDLTLETEIKQLILHGVLHLCGYDHETDKGEMNRRELELRRILEI